MTPRASRGGRRRRGGESTRASAQQARVRAARLPGTSSRRVVCFVAVRVLDDQAGVRLQALGARERRAAVAASERRDALDQSKSVTPCGSRGGEVAGGSEPAGARGGAVAEAAVEAGEAQLEVGELFVGVALGAATDLVGGEGEKELRVLSDMPFDQVEQSPERKRPAFPRELLKRNERDRPRLRSQPPRRAAQARLDVGARAVDIDRTRAAGVWARVQSEPAQRHDDVALDATCGLVDAEAHPIVEPARAGDGCADGRQLARCDMGDYAHRERPVGDVYVLGDELERREFAGPCDRSPIRSASGWPGPPRSSASWSHGPARPPRRRASRRRALRLRRLRLRGPATLPAMRRSVRHPRVAAARAPRLQQRPRPLRNGVARRGRPRRCAAPRQRLTTAPWPDRLPGAAAQAIQRDPRDAPRSRRLRRGRARAVAVQGTRPTAAHRRRDRTRGRAAARGDGARSGGARTGVALRANRLRAQRRKSR